jgi:hypothetical protein
VDLSRAAWRKSTRSQGNGDCVEVADLTAAVAVRDSKDQAGPVLVFSEYNWRNFVNGVKSGDFIL